VYAVQCNLAQCIFLHNLWYECALLHQEAHELLRDALVLNPFLKQWLKKNVWIYGDRIVYVGHEP
jgi:adenine deaminase